MKRQPLATRIGPRSDCQPISGLYQDASPRIPVRRCVAGFVLVSVFAATGVPSWAQSLSDSWPRFLGDHYDGIATEVPADVNWTATPQIHWALDVGDGYGIGSVAQGRYFHFDAVTKPKGDPLEYQSVERLRAIDMADGKELWSSEQPFVYRDMLGYEEGPRSSPTIRDDRIYTLGVTGNLTCRNLHDGTILWSVNTNERYGVVQNFFGVGASPLFLDGRLIVMVGGSPAEDQRVGPMQLDRVSANGTALVAFDPVSGKELWRGGDDLASYSSPRPISIDGETLVLAFTRSGLLAIDPQQGNVRWRYDHRAEILESVNAMMPVVDGNRVLISECYQVGSVLLEAQADACREIWKDPPRDRRAQSLRAHWATPVLVGEYLYGCSGRNAPDSDFRCLEFATGKVKWSDDRRTRTSVTQVGDYLLVLEERGKLQVIEPDPDRLKVLAEWDFGAPNSTRHVLEYPCWAAPIVVGKQVLIRGTDVVLCLAFASQ